MTINREAAAANYGLVPRGVRYLRSGKPSMDEQDAHDVATDALIRATRHHDAPPWPLYVCCLSRAFADWARSPRNVRGRTRLGTARPNRLDLDEIGEWCASEHRGFRAVDARDEADAALDGLPYRQRQIFLMQHHGGYYRREIAERFGVSEATVFNELNEALAVLRGLPIPSRTRRKGA